MALEELSKETEITSSIQEFAIENNLAYIIQKNDTEHEGLYRVRVEIGKKIPFPRKKPLLSITFFVKEGGDLRNNSICTFCQERDSMNPYPFEESEKMIKEFKTYWKENYPNMICS